ncbi:MAG: hypothetical protein RL194_897 [Pseudomonadota bacterium]|jgi:uncharacterized membrane protein YedE/YeeE
MPVITSLIAGLLFGFGLILSGMTNPAKVLGFLDISGRWDPSLMLVMLGALAVSFFAFRYAKKREKSLLNQAINLPVTKQIDRRLIIGSLLFGAGWGLAGYCPGPALTSLLSGNLAPVIFVLAMLAGMAVHEVMERRG